MSDEEERLVGHLILVGPGPVTVDQVTVTPPRSRPPSRETGKEGSLQSWHNINSPVPTMLRQFPAEEQDKSMLANDVVYFCQPEGCSLELSGPKTHVFMLTDTETNTHTYGVCRTFPHLFDAHVTQEGPGTSAKSHDTISIQEWGILSVCILSPHPFFNFFAKCLKTLSHFMEHFGSDDEVLWNDLIRCSKPQGGKGAKRKSPLIIEIEEWIHNLLQLPVPQAGRCGLEVELEVEPEVLICYPPKNRLPLFDLRLCRLFRRIGVHTVIEVVKLILSEQKVKQ